MALNKDVDDKHYFEVLELPNESSQDEVKKAYKRLALKFHPDKNPDEDTTEKFQEISEAYVYLNSKAKRQLGEVHTHYCPHHDMFYYDSDDSYDEDEYDDEYEDDPVWYFRKIFMDVFSEFVFARRFNASKKQRKFTKEEAEEDSFFDFIYKKYREHTGNEYELTEEDLKKFHSYEEWQKARPSWKRPNKKTRQARRKDRNRIPQAVQPQLTKKQQLAEENRREKERQKIAKELAEQIKTKQEKTAKKASAKSSTQKASIESESILKEIETQTQRQQEEERMLAEKLKKAEAEERRKEKLKKRREKKNQKKKEKTQLVGMVKDEDEENMVMKRNQTFETSMNSRTTLLKQSPLAENKMLNKGSKSSIFQAHLEKSPSKKQKMSTYSGRTPAVSTPTASYTDNNYGSIWDEGGIQSQGAGGRQMKDTGRSPTGAAVPSYSAEERDPDLLRKHFKMYEDLMKVQPKRHTEHQLRQERLKDKDLLSQQQQCELDRLRNKQQRQQYESEGQYEDQKSQYLRRQWELERRRNEEEAVSLNTQRMYEIKKKKSEPKWYEEKRTRRHSSPQPEHTWMPVGEPALPKENIWQKRQQVQEEKQLTLNTLLPQTEEEEERMLREALEMSEQTAREDEQRMRERLAAGSLWGPPTQNQKRETTVPPISAFPSYRNVAARVPSGAQSTYPAYRNTAAQNPATTPAYVSQSTAVRNVSGARNGYIVEDIGHDNQMNIERDVDVEGIRFSDGNSKTTNQPAPSNVTSAYEKALGTGRGTTMETNNSNMGQHSRYRGETVNGYEESDSSEDDDEEEKEWCEIPEAERKANSGLYESRNIVNDQSVQSNGHQLQYQELNQNIGSSSETEDPLSEFNYRFHSINDPAVASSNGELCVEERNGFGEVIKKTVIISTEHNDALNRQQRAPDNLGHSVDRDFRNRSQQTGGYFNNKDWNLSQTESESWDSVNVQTDHIGARGQAQLGGELEPIAEDGHEGLSTGSHKPHDHGQAFVSMSELSQRMEGSLSFTPESKCESPSELEDDRAESPRRLPVLEGLTQPLPGIYQLPANISQNTGKQQVQEPLPNRQDQLSRNQSETMDNQTKMLSNPSERKASTTESSEAQLPAGLPDNLKGAYLQYLGQRSEEPDTTKIQSSPVIQSSPLIPSVPGVELTNPQLAANPYSLPLLNPFMAPYMNMSMNPMMPLHPQQLLMQQMMLQQQLMMQNQMIGDPLQNFAADSGKLPVFNPAMKSDRTHPEYKTSSDVINSTVCTHPDPELTETIKDTKEHDADESPELDIGAGVNLGIKKSSKVSGQTSRLPFSHSNVLFDDPAVLQFSTESAKDVDEQLDCFGRSLPTHIRSEGPQIIGYQNNVPDRVEATTGPVTKENIKHIAGSCQETAEQLKKKNEDSNHLDGFDRPIQMDRMGSHAGMRDAPEHTQTGGFCKPAGSGVGRLQDNMAETSLGPLPGRRGFGRSSSMSSNKMDTHSRPQLGSDDRTSKGGFPRPPARQQRISPEENVNKQVQYQSAELNTDSNNKSSFTIPRLPKFVNDTQLRRKDDVREETRGRFGNIHHSDSRNVTRDGFGRCRGDGSGSMASSDREPYPERQSSQAPRYNTGRGWSSGSGDSSSTTGQQGAQGGFSLRPSKLSQVIEQGSKGQGIKRDEGSGDTEDWDSMYESTDAPFTGMTDDNRHGTTGNQSLSARFTNYPQVAGSVPQQEMSREQRNETIRSMIKNVRKQTSDQMSDVDSMNTRIY